MMLRRRGYVYSALVLMLEILFGGWPGCMIAALTAVYALFIGEWYAKKKYGAVLCSASLSSRREKLKQCFNRVNTKAHQKYAHMPKSAKIYIVPDRHIQAYAFGRRSIGVTEGALNLDSRTIEALIAHEYGHIVNGDSVLKMILSITSIVLAAFLAFCQFAFIAVVYLIILIACLAGLFRLNFFSYMITSKLVELFKKIGKLIQHGAFHLLQIIIRAFGRKAELRADSFACSLGYAFYLRTFLERFDIEAPRRETVFDALYATHSPRSVRLSNPDLLQIDRR